MDGADIGSRLANCIMSEVYCKLPKPNGVWSKRASDDGTWTGVLCITVAGVPTPFAAPCEGPLLDDASLVGGGVCICEKSMVTGRDASDEHNDKLRSTLVSLLGSGDDDSLREASTGGKGRFWGAKWLT